MTESEVVVSSTVAQKLKKALCEDAGLDPRITTDGWTATHEGGDDVVVTFTVEHYISLAQFNEYVEESRK